MAAVHDPEPALRRILLGISRVLSFPGTANRLPGIAGPDVRRPVVRAIVVIKELPARGVLARECRPSVAVRGVLPRPADDAPPLRRALEDHAWTQPSFFCGRLTARSSATRGRRPCARRSRASATGCGSTRPVCPHHRRRRPVGDGRGRRGRSHRSGASMTIKLPTALRTYQYRPLTVFSLKGIDTDRVLPTCSRLCVKGGRSSRSRTDARDFEAIGTVLLERRVRRGFRR